jgi:lipoprotein-releasing system permease protein
MFEGILIGTIGSLTGLLLGLLICYMQIQYKLYPLDPTKYILDAIPIQIRISDIFAITGMSMLLTFFASLYPASRAVKISILDAIKWE